MKGWSSLAAAGVLGLALTATVYPSTPAEAQSKCTSGSKVSAAIWEKYGESLKKAGCKKGGEKCAKMEQVVKEMISFWNQQVGNSWATIGPREIVFSGKLDGKVVAGGERLFLTKMPLVDADEVTVTVKKEGGKAPATVSISALGENNQCLVGDEVRFNATDKDGTTKTLKLTGARDRLISIKVDAEKGKAFDYELNVRKK